MKSQLNVDLLSKVLYETLIKKIMLRYLTQEKLIHISDGAAAG
jgi:hypothetical protein